MSINCCHFLARRVKLPTDKGPSKNPSNQNAHRMRIDPLLKCASDAQGIQMATMHIFLASFDAH